MTQRPTGTFRFTDIEGQTRRWDQDPVAAHTALERYDVLVRQAMESQAGQVFMTGV